jgi:hypothetical protein
VEFILVARKVYLLLGMGWTGLSALAAVLRAKVLQS